MRTKLFSILLVAICVVTPIVLAGCAQQGEAPDKPNPALEGMPPGPEVEAPGGGGKKGGG